MSCNFDKVKLVGFFSGELSESEKSLVSEHLIDCRDCRTELEQVRELNELIVEQETYEPPSSIKEQFNTMLFDEMQGAYDKSRSGFFHDVTSLLKWIFSQSFVQAMCIALVAIGSFWIGKSVTEENSAIDAPSTQQIAKLEAEVEQLKSLSLINSLSLSRPSQRLQAVTLFSVKAPSSKTLEALVYLVQKDPNLNIRLAALEKLVVFADQEKVMLSLLESLKSEKESLMLITLIQAMVVTRESRSVPILKNKLLASEIPDPVKGMIMEALQFFAGEIETTKTENII